MLPKVKKKKIILSTLYRFHEKKFIFLSNFANVNKQLSELIVRHHSFYDENCFSFNLRQHLRNNSQRWLCPVFP